MPTALDISAFLTKHQHSMECCACLIALSIWLIYKIRRHAVLLLQHLISAKVSLAQIEAGANGVRSLSLAPLDQEMADNWTIAPFWRRFRDDMIHVREHDKDIFFRSTSFNAHCGAEAFFPLATRFSAYEKLPSWITGVGLIITFAMLMHGLSALYMVGDKVVGIDVLIGSLSTKFAASVTAMACSLSLSFYVTQQEHRVERARALLAETVDRVFSLRTVVQLAVSQQEFLHQMTDSVRHLSTDLGERLSESMTGNLGPQFDKFSQALDRLAAHQERGIDGTFREMLSSFQSTLAQSTSGDFGKLRDVIAATANTIDQAAQQAQKTSEETRKLVSSLGEQVAQQAEVARKTIQTSAEAMTDMTQRYRSQSKEDSTQAMQGFQALGELVRSLQANAAKSQEQGNTQQAELNAAMLLKIEQQVENLVARTGDAVQSQQINQQEALASVVGHVGSSIAQQRAEQLAALTEMTARLDVEAQQRAKNGQAAMAELLQSVGAQSQAMLTQVVETAGTQREQMQRLAESTIRTASTTAQSTIEMNQNLLAKNTQAAQAMQDASTAIGTATQAYHLALQHGEQTVSKIANINSSLTQSASHAVTTSTRLAEAVSAAGSQQSLLSTQQRDSQALIVQADEIFSRLQSGMGGLLSDISTHLNDYQRQTQAGLQQNLQRFDESLGGAVGHLKLVIEELGQELGVLEDMLQLHRTAEQKAPHA